MKIHLHRIVNWSQNERQPWTISLLKSKFALRLAHFDAGAHIPIRFSHYIKPWNWRARVSISRGKRGASRLHNSMHRVNENRATTVQSTSEMTSMKTFTSATQTQKCRKILDFIFQFAECRHDSVLPCDESLSSVVALGALACNMQLRIFHYYLSSICRCDYFDEQRKLFNMAICAPALPVTSSHWRLHHSLIPSKWMQWRLFPVILELTRQNPLRFRFADSIRRLHSIYESRSGFVNTKLPSKWLIPLYRSWIPIYRSGVRMWPMTFAM